MKRNLDLIRHILLVTESLDKPKIVADDFVTEIYSYDEVCYHLSLLVNADYITAIEVPVLNSRYADYIVKQLTNSGCDFLDSIRNDTVFNKTKETLFSTVGTVALEAVKELARSTAKNLLGI